MSIVIASISFTPHIHVICSYTLKHDASFQEMKWHDNKNEISDVSLLSPKVTCNKVRGFLYGRMDGRQLCHGHPDDLMAVDVPKNGRGESTPTEEMPYGVINK